MATAAPRRVQSFSHLPRPRLSREEFLRYIGDRVTAEHARDSDPTDGDVVSSTILEDEVDGAKKKHTVRKDSDPQVPGAHVMESGEVVLEGGAVGSDDASREAMPRRRLLRRWPSSADIGMVTDGR